MSRIINISTQSEEIDLELGRYRIFVLGGFGVNLGKFSISFRNKATSEITKSEKAFWPVQTFAFGKRAKRIFIVDISEAGKYEVLFNKPEALKVKPSNLPISSFFSDFLSTDKIEIVITKKLGIFPILA